MPHIDHGAGDRLAAHVAHLPVHEQDFALLAAIVEPCVALGQRGAGDIERTFDRARRATLDTGLALSLIHTEVQERLDTKTRYQESGFVRLTEGGDVADCRPEFIRLNIEVLDDRNRSVMSLCMMRFSRAITRIVGQAADLCQQVLHVLCMQQGSAHFHVLRDLGLRRVSQDLHPRRAA